MFLWRNVALMMGHKICFYGEMWLIAPKFSLLPLLIWSTAERKVFIKSRNKATCMLLCKKKSLRFLQPAFEYHLTTMLPTLIMLILLLITSEQNKKKIEVILKVNIELQ